MIRSGPALVIPSGSNAARRRPPGSNLVVCGWEINSRPFKGTGAGWLRSLLCQARKPSTTSPSTKTTTTSSAKPGSSYTTQDANARQDLSMEGLALQEDSIH